MSSSSSASASPSSTSIVVRTTTTTSPTKAKPIASATMGAMKRHPYCRTDAHHRTSLYFSRLRTWFRSRLIGWMTVKGSTPPVIAREIEENGYHSGYLVYDSVYDAEYILATWECEIGIQFLDLRLAPNFPPALVVTPSPSPVLFHTESFGTPNVPAEVLSKLLPRSPGPAYGAPFFSQPFAPVTPRRLTASSTERPDTQTVFRLLRQWGPVRTITISGNRQAEGRGDGDGDGDGEGARAGARVVVSSPYRKEGCVGADNGDRDKKGKDKAREHEREKKRDRESASEAPRKQRKTENLSRSSSPSLSPRAPRAVEWAVDVNFWYEEDAERLQREWDGVLVGLRADISVPEWWSGLEEWAEHDVPCTPYCRPPSPVTGD